MPTIGRQNPGATPPVKMMGKGHTTPAKAPSMYSCTSRQGEYPYSVVTEPKAETSDDNTLAHQNSSVDCPQAEMEKMARSMFCGRVSVLVALSAGRLNALALSVEALRAETGKMRLAGMNDDSGSA